MTWLVAYLKRNSLRWMQKGIGLGKLASIALNDIIIYYVTRGKRQTRKKRKKPRNLQPKTDEKDDNDVDIIQH